MNIKGIEFEAGYITVTPESSAPFKIALTELIRAADVPVLNGANVNNVASEGVVGGIPVLHVIELEAGALASTDVVLTHKTRIVDAWVVLTGAGVASTILTIKNTADAITDGMDVSGSDKAIVRAATIDDANHEIDAAGKLRVQTETGATQPACIVYVLGIRVA